MSSHDEYLDALNNYYKLKRQYDDKYNSAKNKILRNTALSKKEKQRRFQILKTKCIICKSDGGSIFTDTGGILRASCGNISKPCPLNIEIQRGQFQLSDNITAEFKELMDETRTDIIRTKLNLLFGYVSEEDAIKLFEELRTKLSEDSEIYGTLRTKYLNIVDNKSRKEDIEVQKVYLYDAVQELKKIMKEYKKDTRIGFIKDALNIYLTRIVPSATKIRELKYKYSTVEFNSEDGTYHLIEEPNPLSTIELSIGDLPKVISNKK